MLLHGRHAGSVVRSDASHGRKRGDGDPNFGGRWCEGISDRFRDGGRLSGGDFDWLHSRPPGFHSCPRVYQGTGNTVLTVWDMAQLEDSRQMPWVAMPVYRGTLTCAAGVIAYACLLQS